MKKVLFALAPVILLILMSPTLAYAHPGRTASDGCHYCRTNCDRWGVGWNVRHCHGGYTAPYVAPVATKKPVTPKPTVKPTSIPTIEPTMIPTETPTSSPTETQTSTPLTEVKGATTENENPLVSLGAFVVVMGGLIAIYKKVNRTGETA